jgi:hypothetical protein
MFSLHPKYIFVTSNSASDPYLSLIFYTVKMAHYYSHPNELPSYTFGSLFLSNLVFRIFARCIKHPLLIPFEIDRVLELQIPSIKNEEN